MQNPTQARPEGTRINNVTRSQMPPLRQKKLYEANVLQVARQRTEERIVKLADGRRVKVIRTYSMVR